MRTNEIPEEEKSKLRFIRELPFILQVPIDRIIQNASSWDKALENIDITLTKLITSIDAIKSVDNGYFIPDGVDKNNRMVKHQRKPYLA